MSAQCSGEVEWEVRNGIGKGIAWDVMLAVSIPCMVQQSSFQKWRGTEKDMKRGDRDGQRLLCKEWLSRLGTFSLEKTLLRKQMRELLKITKDVEDSTGNYLYCLTDIGTAKHLVNLPGGRFKTVGRDFFVQCMISCGAPCCRTLQVVRFCIAPRKTRESQRYFFSRNNKCNGPAPGSRSQCRSVLFLLSTSPLERPLVWPMNAIITQSWSRLRALGSKRQKRHPETMACKA